MSSGILDELVLLRLSSFNDTDAEAIDNLLVSIDGRLDTLEAGGGGGDGAVGWYNVLDHGIAAGGASGSANRIAMRTLCSTVIAAGGGTIYFPEGTYHFEINSVAGDRTSIPLINKGAMNLRLLGDGMKSSILTWGGDSGSASSSLFQIGNDSHFLTVEHLALRQKDAIVNPDGGEQHHLFNLATNVSGNGDVTNVKFQFCHFGVVKGDAINLIGSQVPGGAHAGFAANASSGAIAGTFTSPTVPQRLYVKYPDNWDGGSITIIGTDVAGQTISETVPALVGTTNDGYLTELYFKTVVSGTKSATGVTAGVCTIGFAYEVRDVTVRDCVFDGFVYAGSNPGHGYRTCIAGQRGTRFVRVLNCDMTGSDDQLIDMEPTGDGDLGGWIIDSCKFVAASPAGNAPPSPCISFTGNGNVASQYIEMSSFTRNIVIGRLTGGKLQRCKITDNFFVADTGSAQGDSVIGLTDTVNDVEVSRNHIWTRAILPTVIPIRVVLGSGFAGNGVFIHDNMIRWYGSAAIQVENSSNVSIRGNRLIYMAATTNTDTAIATSNTLNAIDNETIEGNFIEGDRGGGTLESGIVYGPGSAAASHRISITNNRGSGCVSGVRIPGPTGAASFTTPPIVHGNDFNSATTPLNIGSNVYIVVAGNNGDRKMLRGAGTPESNIAAPIGSTYMRTDGGAGTSFYVKESGTGTTGWVAK